MRYVKRLAAVLLAALLLLGTLAGCKAAPESAPPMETEALASGRYMERVVSLPMPEGVSDQMVIGVQPTESGLTVFTCSYIENGDTGYCRYFRHTLAADGSVTTADEAWMNTLAPQGGNEVHVYAGADGTLYMIFSDYNEAGDSVAHVLVSRDNGASGAALSGDGLSSLGMVTSLGILEDGKLAASNFYDGALLLLDETGALVAELESGSRGRIEACAAGGALVAFTVPANNLVRVYNSADGSYTDYEYSFSGHDMPQLAVADGAVYLLDQSGLYRHASGGTLWEKLAEGATSTFGLPDFYASLFCAVPGSPYPSVYTSDLKSLLSYAYDANAASEADKTITVFSLEESDTVRQAVVAFNRTRPDVKVVYTIAMSGASGGTAQDYIKALNTELLAGTGPDVLLLDGLPVDSYIEKDVLAELTQTVSASEPILENIRAASETDGKLYAMPTGFTLPLAIAASGTETAFASLASLADAAEAAAKSGLPLLASCGFSYRTLAYYLLKYYGGAIMDGDANAIATFLADAQRISEATGCTEKLGAGWNALADTSQEELNEWFLDYIASPQVFAHASGLAQDILTHPLGSVGGCMEPFACAAQSGAQIVSVNGQFVPAGVVGINKASAEPEAAAAFVQTMLSYAAQGGNLHAEQFPVNAQAFAELIERENPNSGSGMDLNDGEEFTAMWPEKAQRERLAEVVAGLTTPISGDAALTDMLLPELIGCLDGSSSAEQAAERMRSVLSTYLSE